MNGQTRAEIDLLLVAGEDERTLEKLDRKIKVLRIVCLIALIGAFGCAVAPAVPASRLILRLLKNVEILENVGVAFAVLLL